MRKISILILVVLLTSCISQKKRLKICATCPIQTTVHDSIVTIIKDTTIYISRRGDTITLDNPCAYLCDSLGNLKPFEIKKRKNGIVSTLKSANNKLTFDCATDSLEAIIKGLRQTNRSKTEVKTVTIEKNYTKFDRFKNTFFWIICALLVAYLAFRLKSLI